MFITRKVYVFPVLENGSILFQKGRNGYTTPHLSTDSDATFTQIAQAALGENGISGSVRPESEMLHLRTTEYCLPADVTEYDITKTTPLTPREIVTNISSVEDWVPYALKSMRLIS